MINLKPELIVNEIQDIYLRRNFDALKKFFQEQNQLLDFRFFEVKFTEKTLTQNIKHGMKFVPRDIVFLGATNNATVSFGVGTFNNSEINVTANKVTTLRFFAGKYFNDQSNVQPNKDDVLVFGPETLLETTSSDSTSFAGEIKMYCGVNLPSTKTLWCDGASYPAEKYPKLAKALWDTTTGKYAFGGTGTYPAGAFNVPDMRGNFARGTMGLATTDPNSTTRTASGSGGNTGNNVGSLQTDAFQGHYHQRNINARNELTNVYPNTGTSGVSAAYSAGNQCDYYLNTAQPVTDGTNGTPRTSSETRPRNVYVNYIITTE